MAVQRRFDVVLRGYDPAEVDAHLKRVSEWFSQSRAGQLARDQERRFTLREEQVSAREREAHELLAGARVEEQATLEGARLRAESQLREAERIRADAASERERLLGETALQATASEIVTTARERAGELSREADQLLADATGGLGNWSPTPAPRPSGSLPTPRANVSSSWTRPGWPPSS